MINHVQFPGLDLTLTVNRVALTIGGLNIYWYGVCIALGLALALVFVLRKSKSFGVNDDRFIDVIILSTICAIIGARAYYVAFAPFQYNSFAEVINIRDGGVAIYGAVIAAFLSAWLFCKLRKVPVLPAFDLAAMGFLIGQGVGRWGNFFNQEAFGTNTSLPWGMYSEGTQAYLASVQRRLAGSGVIVDPSMPVHPTFLYESIWCLLGFFLLWAYSKRRRFNGEIMLMYFIWYGLERALVEGLRTDSLDTGSGMRVSQMVAIVSVVVAFALWLWLRKKYKDHPLMVSYDFAVKPKEKGTPLVTMTWKASDPLPTQVEIEAAYAAKSETQCASAGDGTAADEKKVELDAVNAAPEDATVENHTAEETASESAAAAEPTACEPAAQPAAEKPDAAKENADAVSPEGAAKSASAESAAADAATTETAKKQDSKPKMKAATGASTKKPATKKTAAKKTTAKKAAASQKKANNEATAQGKESAVTEENHG